MADQPISGIYEIVNVSNGKRYIGSSVDVPSRWKMHSWALRQGRHHSRRLQASWTKHGASGFVFAVIEHCAAASLIEREQHYLDTFKPVYNVVRTAGGGGGFMSEAGRQRVAESNRRRTGWTMSAEARALISKAKLGNTATKGKPRNASAVAKTAAAHRGMKRSEETRAKIAAAKTGKKMPPRSPEHRAKMSAAHKGRQKSPEHLFALQEGRRRRVYTPEQRAQIGAASRAAWALRKI